MKLPLAAVILAATSFSTSAQTFQSSAGELKVETVVSGLANPWSLAFLPDGRMLVTEKPGRLRIATRDGKLSLRIGDLPRKYRNRSETWMPEPSSEPAYDLLND